MITQYYSLHQTFEAEFHTTAMGTNQSFTYLASFLGFYLLPVSYLATENVAFASALSVLAPLMSLVCVFSFVSLKEKEDNSIHKIQKEMGNSPARNSTNFTPKNISAKAKEFNEEMADEEVLNLKI